MATLREKPFKFLRLEKSVSRAQWRDNSDTMIHIPPMIC